MVASKLKSRGLRRVDLHRSEHVETASQLRYAARNQLERLSTHCSLTSRDFRHAFTTGSARNRKVEAEDRTYLATADLADLGSSLHVDATQGTEPTFDAA